jgi:predicted DNA-binding transcriptional regulator YafY
MRTDHVRVLRQDRPVPDPTVRVLRLLALLGSARPWRGEDLAERLGVTARTVRRDVERLRDLGYRVDAAPGPAGGYLLGPGADLPPLLLDDDAAVTVAVALHLAASGAIAGAEEAALRATAALERVLPARLRRRVAALQSATVSLPGSTPAVDAALLGVLASACRDGERLRFRYTDRDGQGTRRHVEPHRLVCSGRRWYLVARDLEREDWRSFRVDRLTEPLPTGVRSRPADPPDAARYVSEGLAAGPYRWRARVLLEAPADVVAARVPPTVAVVEVLDGDRCLLTTGADSLEAIAAHLVLLDLGFAVLEPPELRDTCRALAGRLQDAADGDRALLPGPPSGDGARREGRVRPPTLDP